MPTLTRDRLQYLVHLVDDPVHHHFNVTGSIRCHSSIMPEFRQHPFLKYEQKDDALHFSGQVPGSQIDYTPLGLDVCTDFYPKPMDQNLPCDFQVSIKSQRKAMYATGKLTDGFFCETNVNCFAVVLSDTFMVIADHTRGIDLRCFYYPHNQELAHTILRHAKEDLASCIDLMGFYPYQALTFLPGSAKWQGGCPVATGVLAFHHQPDDRVLINNNTIIAHEICHEYWGEYVKNAEQSNWLVIGLGLITDYHIVKEDSLHQELVGMYYEACKQNRRTAIDLPKDEINRLMNEYDYNSAVIHGKSLVIMKNILALIGKDAFFAAMSWLLATYRGRSIRRGHFLDAVKRHSGQNLTSLLTQWLHADECIEIIHPDK